MLTMTTPDGIRLAYLDEPATGADRGEPILLIHGFASSHAVNWVFPTWVKTLTAAGRRVILYDVRGHGRSDKLYDPAAYEVRVLAADALALMDHLGLGRIDVMGYSMGARIAAFLERLAPERVRVLVLGGLGMGLVEGGTLPMGIADAMDAPALESLTDPHQRMFRAFADATKSDRRALAACIRGARALMPADEVAEIACPTLVCVGTDDDIAGDPVGLAALMSRAEAFDIEGRDHNKAVGDKTYKEAVLEFLGNGCNGLDDRLPGEFFRVTRTEGSMAALAQSNVVSLTERDPVFARMHSEAHEIIRREPEIAGFIYSTVLNHESLESMVVHRVAARLAHADVPADLIRQAYTDIVTSDSSFAEAFRADLLAVFDRDPACTRLVQPILYFKGFHAIQAHRLAHALWKAGRHDFALYLQSRSSVIFQTDINPEARIGKGVFLDHATGLVVGATAVIDDDVSMLQDVTLGGTGKDSGDRHPKVRHGVLIGAGAKILGNIEVGHCARIAAGSVVLHPVPHNKTVAGVPARIVGEAGCAEPARTMDQILAAKPTFEMIEGRSVIEPRR